jgi:hypothetical protein
MQTCFYHFGSGSVVFFIMLIMGTTTG